MRTSYSILEIFIILSFYEKMIEKYIIIWMLTCIKVFWADLAVSLETPFYIRDVKNVYHSNFSYKKIIVVFWTLFVVNCHKIWYDWFCFEHLISWRRILSTLGKSRVKWVEIRFQFTLIYSSHGHWIWVMIIMEK